MDYKIFCGDKVSALGFGCMRLPQTADGHIDSERTHRMFDRAREAGINYFDTAWPYHNGESEPFTGSYFATVSRSSFYLATKLPVWEVKERSDAETIFARQLERLQTTYIDFYLLHALNTERFDKMVETGTVDYLLSEQKAGRIRHFGFSFHDGYDSFERILSYRNWDFCQIQYNYMDTEEQAGERGRALAERRGIPLIVMEPVKGGSLTNLPADVVRPFTELKSDASTASWAVRFAAGRPDVKVVLSGMSNEAQLEDNIRTFSPFIPLSTEETAAVGSVRAAIESRIRNGCTGCQYCMPCPFGVDIPQNFRIWNDWGMYGNKNGTIWSLSMLKKDGKTAGLCRKCGACETKCPQKLPIRSDLAALEGELKQLSV
jgi:uncharacterized protein